MIKMFPGVTGQCGEQGYLITISGKQVFFFLPLHTVRHMGS